MAQFIFLNMQEFVCIQLQANNKVLKQIYNMCTTSRKKVNFFFLRFELFYENNHNVFSLAKLEYVFFPLVCIIFQCPLALQFSSLVFCHISSRTATRKFMTTLKKTLPLNGVNMMSEGLDKLWR